ncbi:MAG: bifunctional pyr operon transcriptional regulator/uracil phosphoribosyltransferase PyrR [Candidatus Dormibacteria bacterium]
MTVQGGVPTTLVMDGETAARTLRRLAHEIVERHPQTDDLVLVAVRGGGVPIARALADALARLGHPALRCALLDVRDYRDDIPRPTQPDGNALTGLDGDGAAAPLIGGAAVILVDDVVQTGRTLRAALDCLSAWGRPATVEPCVLIDRGQRELPIRPSFVGKNIPAAADDWVQVMLDVGTAAEAPGVFLVKRT